MTPQELAALCRAMTAEYLSTRQFRPGDVEALVTHLPGVLGDLESFDGMCERIAASGYKVVDQCCRCGCDAPPAAEVEAMRAVCGAAEVWRDAGLFVTAPTSPSARLIAAVDAMRAGRGKEG